MNDEPITKRKALSYIRYSSLVQGKQGKDSTRRQKEALEDALEHWNLEFDQQFIDKAKSGFKQKHLAKGGAMHELREMAKRGELKGKVLVVEDWDRAGRMRATDAAPLLLDIINNEVDMVVGDCGGEYFSKALVDDNLDTFTRALREMDRGYRESKRKSGMAIKKWQARMEKVAKGEPVALNSLPFWLKNVKNENGECTGKYIEREGMPELVEQIFKLYINGRGAQSICNDLKRENVPMPGLRLEARKRKNGNVWHGTFIQQLIKNRAVLGYYRNTDSKIFKQIISDDLYYQANLKRKERTTPRFAGRKSLFVNPYAGLCVCSFCGGGISPHRSNNSKSKKEYIYLECRESKRDDCTGKGVRYERFEESFTGFFGKVKNFTNEAKAISKVSMVKAKIAEATEQRDKLESTIRTALEDTKATSNPVSAVKLLMSYDTKIANLQNELEQEIIVDRGTTPFSKSDAAFLQSLFREKKLQDRETRLIIQEALRRAIKVITFEVKKQSYTVEFKGNDDVYMVQLLPNGFEMFKNTKRIGAVIDLDQPARKKQHFETAIERAHRLNAAKA